MIDLQKAPNAKRMFAFFADLVVAAMLTVGVYLLMSTVIDTDKYSAKYDEIRISYEERYGVEYTVTAEEYAKMTPEEQAHYTEAVDAMNADAEANEAITTYYALSFIIFTSGIFLSMVLLEFVVPAIARDGRTLGKMLFGIGVMRTGYTKISAPVLFVRNIIGKCVMEIILPIVIAITAYAGITGIFGWVMLLVFAVAETVALAKSGANRFLHDIMADTVAVDWSSQMIFETAEQRDEYLEKQKRNKAAEYETY